MVEDIKTKYYFCGIGGIGMSALAQLLVDRGDWVGGSDRDTSPVTEMLEQKGIVVNIGQKAENVPDDTAVLIYSDAVPPENPERARAAELGIPQLSYFEMLGRISQEKRTIAIAGTNGKTTTTGMAAALLRDAGVSPMAVVGSIVKDFGSNYLPGESDLFVVEACEYQRHFLNLSPFILVINNLEFDHTDYFTDLADVQSAFRTMMEKVPANGVIITDIENPNIQPLLEGLTAPIINYTQEDAYELLMPGEFNQMNARAARAVARYVAPDFTDAEARKTFGSFHGTWRRFEYKGTTMHGAELYDDYAHHPTAIQETLRALRARVEEKGGGKIVIAFHPHLYSRTRDLFDGFIRSFKDADEVIVAPIYGAREIDDGTISNEMLARAITENGTPARAADSLDQVQQWLGAYGAGTTIMTMGAGDIYKVADALMAHEK